MLTETFSPYIINACEAGKMEINEKVVTHRVKAELAALI
jgi:hypothetical protein